MSLTLTLLAPLGLAALIALGVPILIHLVRRIELRTTEFAALRWISDRIRPRRRIRFERPWLLALRLLLLALVALLLAQPVISEMQTTQRARVVVAPGADMDAARAAITDASADWRWLAPGFPAIETSPPSGIVPVASLLRELDADLPARTTLTVIVPAELAGLDGERAILSRSVEWRVVPGHGAVADKAKAQGTDILAVRYAAPAEPALKFVRATVDAWNARGPGRYSLDAQAETVAVAANARWLIWLGSSELPSSVVAWIEAGGTAIVPNLPDASGVPAWRDADGQVLARAQMRAGGRVIALPAAFAPGTFPQLLDAGFPTRLLEVLQGTQPPTRAPAVAVAPVQARDIAGAVGMLQTAKPLDPWLALLIAALFLIERAIATRERVPA